MPLRGKFGSGHCWLSPPARGESPTPQDPLSAESSSAQTAGEHERASWGFEAASMGGLEDEKVIYITPRRPARRAARDARRPRRRIRRPMRRPCRRDCRRSMPTVCASAGSDATRAGAVTAIAAAANQPNSLRRETCSNIQTSQSVPHGGSVADAAWAWQTRHRSRELGHWRANKLIACARPSVLIDSSAVKAHRSASGGKGGSSIRRSAARAEDARPRSTP